MSQTLIKVLAGSGFALATIGVSARWSLGIGREIAVTAVRAIVQLAAVGAIIALVFKVPPLAAAFVAVMGGAAAFTSAGRLQGLPRAIVMTSTAIIPPAIMVTGVLLALGAFDFTARSIVPTAGILIGGAMAATTLTGRRLLEKITDDNDEVEARLALGDSARTALQPAVRHAVHSGLVPAIDQTRTVGLVALPGTFIGLILGGASPSEAAATQLVVLLSLLFVEITAGLLIATLACRALIAPGERVIVPAARVRGRRLW